MIFRSASPEEAAKLTQLTLDSKRYWGYPEEYIAIWTEELTVRSDYIEKNMVVLAEENTEILGYISIIQENPRHTFTVGTHKMTGGYFLDNLFIHPSYIRRGIGKKLIAIAFDWCKERQISRLHVFSDPNAKGFYEKMGAVCLGELPSNNVGRPLPFLVFNFMT